MTFAGARARAVGMVTLVLAWENFKDWLSATVHLSHWDLHAIVGVALFLLFGRAMRRRLTSFLPVVPVAVLEFGNEALDGLRARIGHWYWNWPDTLIEVALTLGPPLAIAAAARVLRRR